MLSFVSKVWSGFKSLCNMVKREVLAIAAVLLSLVAMPSHALDTTAVEGAITEAGVAAAAIGIAVLIMTVGIKVFKWVRRAL